MPANPRWATMRSARITSRGLRPPGSGLLVPGAKPGSKASMSTLMYGALPWRHASARASRAAASVRRSSTASVVVQPMPFSWSSRGPALTGPGDGPDHGDADPVVAADADGNRAGRQDLTQALLGAPVAFGLVARHHVDVAVVHQLPVAADVEIQAEIVGPPQQRVLA